MLDVLPLTQFGDASVLLQDAIDAGGRVVLPPCRLTLHRPVYLSAAGTHALELTGTGPLASILAVNGAFDALVALPEMHRRYNPAPHVGTNPLAAGRWSFRTQGTAGIRLHQTIADQGWPGADHWSGVRQFTIEATISRHGGAGGILGAAWPGGSNSYRAAPVYLSQHPDHTGHLDFRVALTTGEKLYRFAVGSPSGTPVRLRFAVNLDAGTVACDKDGTPVTDVTMPDGAIAAGAVLAGNPGSPFWVGGLTPQSGGPPPPELGCADVTFHAFRLWRTATPPAPGVYDPFAWYPDTVLVLPLADDQRPVAGDPAVYFTGEQSGYGYLTPLAGLSSGWVPGLVVRGLSVESNHPYGAGLAVVSALDVDVSDLRVNRFAVGMQVTGGPLPSYPVRVRRLRGEHQGDCVARFARSIVREVSAVAAQYPVRSAIRVDSCGEFRVWDVLHAGENAGPLNTVTDCLYVDCCGLVDVGTWLSNYEDGSEGGPRNSYLRLTGKSPEPGQEYRVRVKDFAQQTLRPGASFIDTDGLDGDADVSVENSFDMLDGTLTW